MPWTDAPDGNTTDGGSSDPETTWDGTDPSTTAEDAADSTEDTNSWIDWSDSDGDGALYEGSDPLNLGGSDSSGSDGSDSSGDSGSDSSGSDGSSTTDPWQGGDSDPSTQISIGSPRVPNRARPGENVDVSASVTNNATFIGPEDRCDSSAIGLEGIEVRLEVLVDGQRVDSSSACIAGTGYTTEFNLTWTTPNVSEVQTKTVEYVAKGAQSGEVKDRLEQTITLDPDAPEQPDDNNGGNNPLGNLLGGIGGEGGGPIEKIAMILALYMVAQMVMQIMATTSGAGMVRR
ncbi:hypothetical protein ACFQMA_09280 [Halosimplex aquaticum]|uniref:CARDB protein n=1 Tax=Halosimplex aquaticum TaxID=3026162 RepID=A0ABD5XYA9_9EURY|nr:hypothetical protein [Halosimplex aquaticum]